MYFRRGVYDEYIAAVGEIQDSLDVLIGKFPDLVHHAMECELSRLLLEALFEHVYQKDVDDGFDKDVGAVGAYHPNVVDPSRGVVILLDLEFKGESGCAQAGALFRV